MNSMKDIQREKHKKGEKINNYSIKRKLKIRYQNPIQSSS